MPSPRHWLFCFSFRSLFRRLVILIHDLCFLRDISLFRTPPIPDTHAHTHTDRQTHAHDLQRHPIRLYFLSETCTTHSLPYAHRTVNRTLLLFVMFAYIVCVREWACLLVFMACSSCACEPIDFRRENEIERKEWHTNIYSESRRYACILTSSVCYIYYNFFFSLPSVEPWSRGAECGCGVRKIWIRFGNFPNGFFAHLNSFGGYLSGGLHSVCSVCVCECAGVCLFERCKRTC